MSKYFNDKRYCHCFDVPTSDGLGVCKDCRGYTNICYSCVRCLHCWYTSQIELFTEYDEPKLLAYRKSGINFTKLERQRTVNV
jgi:hypothetical protein